MRLEQSFTVKAPIAEVWAALVEPQRVASCLPGAQLGEPGDDGSFNGSFKVRLGPTTAEYRGTLKVSERDDDAHRVVMLADGRDRRGQGGAKATIASALGETAGGTEVAVDTEYAITGRLASFSRGGMVEDISKRLLGEFAACLQERLGGDTAPAPVEAPAPVPEPAPGATPARAPEPAPEAAAPPPPPPPPAAPLDAGNLVAGVLRERAKAAAPFALAALALGWLLGRAGRP